MKNLRKEFAGLKYFLKSLLYRERLFLIISIISFPVIIILFAAVFQNMYKDPLELLAMGETMRNPAMIAMVGKVFSNHYNLGIMYANMMFVFLAIAIIILNITLVVKHTRKDEEYGRLEMIRSLPFGRNTVLGSILITAMIMNFSIAFLTGIGLGLFQFDNMNWSGSLLFSANLGAIGLLFAAIAAIFAQISENSRGATSLTYLTLGVFYILRAIGDLQVDILSFISPLGLMLHSQVFVHNYIYPVFIIIFLAICSALLAFKLSTLRDLGSGFLKQKQGRDQASVFLRQPLGLSFRLSRNFLIIWFVAILLCAATYGSIFGELEKFLTSNEFLAQAFTATDKYTVTDIFISVLFMIMSILATIPIIFIILKFNNQEREGYNENIISKSCSKSKLLGSYLIIAIIFSLLMQITIALTFYSLGAIMLENHMSLASSLISALLYLPAQWMMIALAMLLTSFLPNKTSLIWFYLGLSFFLNYLGQIAKLPEILQKLSPFGYIFNYPIERFNLLFFIPLLIALVSIILSFIKIKKRDMYFNK